MINCWNSLQKIWKCIDFLFLQLAICFLIFEFLSVFFNVLSNIYKGPHFKFWLDWKKKTKILCSLFCLSVHKWWNLWVYQTVVHARRYFNCLLGSNIVCFDYGPSIILPTRSNNQFRNYIDIPNDNLQVREI